MARPQTDIEAGREQLLDAVEDLIRQRGAVDISLVELAGVVGMSASNIYRFFESKEDLYSAVAERWFAEKIAIMEEVVGLDLSPRDKMFEFFARRFVSMMASFEAEPELFISYMELGREHLDVVRGHIDLGDHYLAILVVEAMEMGYFPGLNIDRVVSLINQMVVPYCNPDVSLMLMPKLNVEKLGQIIDAVFAGLGQFAKQRESVILNILE
jgi:AcrR family transcriptional regulator